MDELSLFSAHPLLNVKQCVCVCVVYIFVLIVFIFHCDETLLRLTEDFKWEISWSVSSSLLRKANSHNFCIHIDDNHKLSSSCHNTNFKG